MESKLSDFAEGKKTFEEDDLDRVMGLMCSKGACYPSEMARDLHLEIGQINSVIARLIRERLARKLLPDRIYPQALIACRISEMWANRVEGYDSFCMRSWIILTQKGVETYCEKHLGQHYTIIGPYVETYPELFDLVKVKEIDFLKGVTSSNEM
ncbi:MAG: hypothetical protein ACUZ8N_10830 [Candidatus Scalindua sp.]